MKILKKLTASALLLCMLTAMLVVPAAAASAIVITPAPVGDTVYYRTSVIGTGQVFTASLDPIEAITDIFHWNIISPDPSVTLTPDPSIPFNQSVTVTPIKAGITEVEVSYGSTSLKRTIVFRVVPPTMAFVSPVDTIDLNTSSSADYTVSVAYGGTVVATPAIDWSIDSSTSAGASVDLTGKLTVSNPGVIELRATYHDDPSYFVVQTVSVVKPVTAILINNDTPLALTVGDSSTITAAVSPNDHTGTLTWESLDPTIASVDTTGTVTANAKGSTRIRLSSGAVEAFRDVVVQDVPTPQVTVDGELNLTFYNDEINAAGISKTATCAGASGDFSWIAPPAGIVDLMPTGTDKSQCAIIPRAVGSCTITVGRGSATPASIYVTVKGPEIAAVTLPMTLSLKAGESATLTPDVTVQSRTPDTAENKAVNWMIYPGDNGITVDATGKISVAAGTPDGTQAVVTCKSLMDPSKTASCLVTVVPNVIPVTGITLDKTTLSLTTVASELITATVAPTDATNKSVTWSSSDTAVAIVVDGMVTAIAPGTAVITATAADGSGISASCNVTVTDPIAPVTPVTGITLDKTTLSLTTGGSEQLTATVAPTDATNKTVTWSSDNTAVAIVVDGMVAAVAPGTAVITATAADGSGISASCNVTVTDPVTPAVTVTGDYGMDLVFNNNEIGVAASNVSKTAACDTATGDFTWAVVSGDPAVVALKTSGTNNSGCVISPKAAGSCVIRVSRGTATPAYINVTVKNPEIESLTLPAEINMEAGTDQALAPVISFKAGTNDTNENRAVKWTISPGNNGITIPLIGTVDGCMISVAQNTPVNTEATVTCTSLIDPTKTATCKIKVSQSIIPVTAVTLDKPTLALSTTGASRSYKLTATVTPANATNRTVTWTSGNSAVATVSADGTVTAMAPGIANITATAGDVSAVCTVSVTTGTTTGPLTITPSPRSISAIGGYSELTASIPNAFGSQQVISSDLITWNIDTTRSNGKATFNRVGNRVFLYGSFAGTVVVTGSYVTNGITYTGQVSIGITPMLTYGNYSAYDGRNHMRFLTNEVYPGDPSRVSVIVDGYALAHGMHCYTQSAPNGYIMVTLNNAFLNTLNPAVIHTIQIGTPGNLATGYFRSYGHSSSIYGVRTGDESQPALWAALCIMSLLGAGTILISRRRDWKV